MLRGYDLYAANRVLTPLGQPDASEDGDTFPLLAVISASLLIELQVAHDHGRPGAGDTWGHAGTRGVAKAAVMTGTNTNGVAVTTG